MLQATNRVLRGSGRELLALASPSALSPDKASRLAAAAAAAAAATAASPPAHLQHHLGMCDGSSPPAEYKPWAQCQVSVPYSGPSTAQPSPVGHG